MQNDGRGSIAEIGRYNRLKVVKEVDFGLYLDGGSLGEILLPKRYVPRGKDVGDEIMVFLYHDSEDRLIATTEHPYAAVGEFACLQVVSVNRFGAFLDWGLPKDLLVPFSEQKPKMEVGKRYVVALYVDEESGRIAASARLDEFLYDESEGEFLNGEAVELFVAGRTDLGYKMIVNRSHWGLLHDHETSRRLRRGERLKGYIRKIRQDGKIDLCLHLLPSEKSDEVAEKILDRLRESHGFLAVTDRSSPDLISQLFGTSKKMYKKAVGTLYRQRRIKLENDGIRLIDN